MTGRERLTRHLVWHAICIMSLSPSPATLPLLFFLPLPSFISTFPSPVIHFLPFLYHSSHFPPFPPLSFFFFLSERISINFSLQDSVSRNNSSLAFTHVVMDGGFKCCGGEAGKWVRGGVLGLSLTRFLQCLVPSSLVPFLWDFPFFFYPFGSLLFWFLRSRVLLLLLLLVSYSCLSARLGMKSEERVRCEGGVI